MKTLAAALSLGMLRGLLGMTEPPATAALVNVTVDSQQGPWLQSLNTTIPQHCLALRSSR